MIAVVLLTYRADPVVFDRCLASVVASCDADLVVVVDNGQTLDRTRIDALAGAARVDLVATNENRGFAGGMNVGISHALAEGATGIALLNDDTTVEPGWLRTMATHLRAGDVGAVQPKILLEQDPDADAPPRINSVGMSVRGDGAGVDVGFGEEDRGQHDDSHDIALFTGGAVLLSARMLTEVGGFDERYFMYYEDIDFGRRGAEAGWRYIVEPAAVVHHAWSSTARTVPHLHRYWQERNRLWWLFRHGSVWNVARGLVLSFGRLLKHPSRPQATAVRDGVLGVGWCVRDRRARRLVVAPLPVPPDGWGRV